MSATLEVKNHVTAGSIKLIVEKNTHLVRQIAQSSTLPDDMKFFVPAGRELELNWSKPQEDDQGTPLDEGNYFQVSLKEKINGFHNWFLFRKHGYVSGTDATAKQAIVAQSTTTVSGGLENSPIKSEYDFEFRLPGFNGVYNMAHAIRYGHRNKWYEALHFNPKTKHYRKPVNASVVNGIIRIDTELEEAREVIAERYNVSTKEVVFRINSWYRDPATNRRVGGASQSRHLVGDAVDMRVVVKGGSIAPPKINKVLDRWASRHGLASASVFTHIDARGYRARWSYGF